MSRIVLPESYPYLYETHMHTSSGSACGACSGQEMAQAYQQAGYSGMVVTDHNWGGNTAVGRNYPWKEWVRKFSEGYEEAREWGNQNEFAVFWGYESGYRGTEFLIFGLNPEFMLEHPELQCASVEEQYRIVKTAGGIVVHAHPFREAYYIPEVRLYPEFVDAVEGINASHYNRFLKESEEQGVADESPWNKEIYNDKAVAYAQKHGLPVTAGSDMHHTWLFGGGMAFSEPPGDEKDFCRKILSDNEAYLLTDGVRWYNKWGKPLGSVEWIP